MFPYSKDADPRGAARSRRIFGATLAAVAASTFLAALTGLRDPDMFHHLAYGRYVAQNGLPSSDPFLYPLAGTALGVMPYWLGALALYASTLLAGMAGPVLLAAAVGALTFVLLLVHALDGERSPGAIGVALLPLALAYAAWAPRLVPRTEIFGVLLLVVTMMLLRAHERGSRGAIWLFPVIAPFWTNVHGSLPMGVALLGAWVAGEVLRRAWIRVRGAAAGGERGPRILPVAAAAAVGFAAGFLSPSKLNPIPFAVRFVLSIVFGVPIDPDASAWNRALPVLRHSVTELKPFSPQDWIGVAGALFAVTILSFVAARRKARPGDALVLAVFVGMTIPASRVLAFAAVAAGAVASRNLVAAYVAHRERRGAPVVAWALAAVGVVSAGWSIGHLPVSFGFAVDRDMFPVRASEYMRANGVSANVYDTFHFGGYLEWTVRQPVFQDGRGLVPAGEEQAAMEGPSAAALFDGLDARYRFDALVIQHPVLESGSARTFLAVAQSDDWSGVPRKDWALVAFDDGGLLYLRRDGRYRDLIARDEFRYLFPSNAPEAIVDTRIDPGVGLAEAERSLREAPGCDRCGIAVAGMRFRLGDLDGAEAVLTGLRSSAIVGNVAKWLFAKVALARGDPVLARGRFEELLASTGNRAGVQRELARIALARGEYRRALQLAQSNVETEDGGTDDVTIALSAARALGLEREARAYEARLGAAFSFEQGRAHFEQAVRLYAAGRLDDAIAAYRTSLEAFEPSAPAHANLGFAYQDQKRYREAVVEFRRAIEVDATYSLAHYGLASVLELEGDASGAARSFREYLRLEPRGRWSLRAEDHLRRLTAR